MYRKESFHLRFIGLSETAEQVIRGAVPDADFKTRAATVLVFELREDLDLRPVCELLDGLAPGSSECEVIASLVTESDTGGIELPEYILRVIRRTGCRVGFSFVNVGPEEEGQPSPAG